MILRCGEKLDAITTSNLLPDVGSGKFDDSEICVWQKNAQQFRRWLLSRRCR